MYKIFRMRRLKTLLIIALAVLAVYQTGQLWFVNITNHSFLNYLTAFFNPATPDGYSDIVRPSRVVFGNGDGLFDMRYGVTVPVANEAITEVLRRGVFEGAGDAESVLGGVLQGAVVLYEYAFAMRADIFAPAFNQRSGFTLTDRGINYFDAVAVSPNHVTFLTHDRAWTFSLPDGVFSLPDFYIDPELYFINTGSRTFLPQVQNRWRHHPLRIANPYANPTGDPQLDTVNAQVAHFFDNPAIRNLRMADNIITISTINTVVRYLPGNVLEYIDFRPIRRNNPPDLMTDFSAALAFINRDPHAVSHDFFLAGYEVQGRTHVFWFNYIIGEPEAGGFPLLAPEQGWGPAHDPLHFPIEIVVDHGRVSRYRKVAFLFDLDTTQQQVLTRASLMTDGEGVPFLFGYPAVQGAGLVLRAGGNR
jgi:hypothetical protein